MTRLARLETTTARGARQHMPMKALALLPALALAVAVGAAPQTVGLARDGKALLKIAVAAQPTSAEQTAATELAAYLQKVTGATLDTVAESSLAQDAPAIYLGQTDFARRHTADPASLDGEEWLLKTTGGSLILAGGRPRGTLYAVYHFLEDELGCRWYTPWIEKAPRRPVFHAGPLDRRAKPFMKMRSMYTHLSDGRCGLEGQAWAWFCTRNRLNDYYGDQYGGGVRSGGRGANHSFHQYVPPEKYFKDHPEYYSERNGQRVPSTSINGNQLCLTNPDVLRIVTEGVEADIAQNPWGSYYSVSINDGGVTSICDCPKCQAVADVEVLKGLGVGVLKVGQADVEADGNIPQSVTLLDDVDGAGRWGRGLGGGWGS